MAKKSEDYRDLSIDCFVELDVSNGKGWASKSCEEYKEFALNGLHKYKEDFKTKGQEFVNSSKKVGLAGEGKLKGLNNYL